MMSKHKTRPQRAQETLGNQPVLELSLSPLWPRFLYKVYLLDKNFAAIIRMKKSLYRLPANK